MTAAEECAVFLSTRGQCLMAAGRLDEAIAAHEAAARLTPDSRFFQTILNFARRDVAARRAPEFPRVGMPPDPTLWDEPPEIAWVLWHQQQALRHPNRLLPGGIPEPQLGIPTTGNPINVNNFNLTQPPKTR